MDENHRELVESAVRGNGGAIEVLLREHLPGLLGYVRLRAGSELLAQESTLDFVQSACREVLQDLSRFRIHRDELDFKRWLYASVERKIVDRARYYRRECRDIGRAASRDPALAADEVAMLTQGYSSFFTPSHQASMREELARVERAFRELPEHYREVILQVRILGRSPSELVGELGPTPGAVRVLLHRAVARLARRAGLTLSGDAIESSSEEE